MLTALRHRPFRRPLAALAVSRAGDWLYNPALLAFVYARRHSATWVAVTTAAWASLGAPAAHAAAPTPETLAFTGAEQSYTVPAGVTRVHVIAIGAPGGSGAAPAAPGGRGAQVDADLAVTPGQVLSVEVGGSGGDGDSSGFGGSGGFNGGAQGGFTGGGPGAFGGGGGGASDVRRCSTAAASCTLSSLDSRLLVAGGGGGGAGAGGGAGGDAGGLGAAGGSGGPAGGSGGPAGGSGGPAGGSGGPAGGSGGPAGGSGGPAGGSGGPAGGSGGPAGGSGGPAGGSGGPAGGSGGDGQSSAGGGGGGGTASAGGSGGAGGRCAVATAVGTTGEAGVLGLGGIGGSLLGGDQTWGGGGGGGLYGGGGGGDGCSGGGGGGGGGSSFGPAGATFRTAAAGTAPSVTLTPLQPAAEVTPGSLSFGSQAQSTISSPRTVTVSNVGNAPLSVTGLSFSGPGADAFLVGSWTCGGAIAPAASCAVTVRFAPQAAGPVTATLRVAGDDPAGDATVSLAGTGDALPHGLAGPRGPAGPQGPAGATGTQGSAGLAPARRPAVPRGPHGRPGTVALITCRRVAVHASRHGHRVTHRRRRCTTRPIARGVRFTASAHATLARHGRVYATGAAKRGRLVLRAHRRLRRGRYALTLVDGRRTTRRIVGIR